MHIVVIFFEKIVAMQLSVYPFHKCDSLEITNCMFDTTLHYYLKELAVPLECTIVEYSIRSVLPEVGVFLRPNFFESCLH